MTNSHSFIEMDSKEVKQLAESAIKKAFSERDIYINKIVKKELESAKKNIFRKIFKVPLPSKEQILSRQHWADISFLKGYYAIEIFTAKKLLLAASKSEKVFVSINDLWHLDI